jgi:signal transduction histidine kinase
MPKSHELLRTRERLLVGRRFLTLRPKIVAFGVFANGLLLSRSSAPDAQKGALLAALGLTALAFFVEGAWVRRRGLSERWLFASLTLTLVALSTGAALSGGMSSPVLPLVPTPVVVGFAAFEKSRRSLLLLAVALTALVLVAWLGPSSTFPALPLATASHMLLVSSVLSLLLVWVGVVGLLEAHSRIASELDRMREDMLNEAERRATSVEHLGAHVAHEVKNPLAAARGLVQLVQRKTSDERDRERLDVVVREVDRALGILADYLSFARPLGDLSLAEVDLGALLQDVAGVLEARASERGVRLELGDARVSTLGDRQRLRDAVLNLALNAIQAMPRGGTLRLSAIESDGCVSIGVLDDGTGMTEDQKARLGQQFASASEGGTGLGVLLARAAARQHGGELHFESAPGKGTRATLQLPSSAGALPLNVSAHV